MPTVGDNFGRAWEGVTYVFIGYCFENSYCGSKGLGVGNLNSYSNIVSVRLSNLKFSVFNGERPSAK